jgi:hypothetical protein
MNQTLAEYLAAENADATTVQHAVRYVVAELSDYMPSDRMRRRLVEEFGDEDVFDETFTRLSTDGSALLDVDLVVLAALWLDGETRETVRGAIADAKAKLPIVEVAIIALVAMYGMYLLATKGQKCRVRKVSLTDKGWVETETVEYEDFSAPVKGLSVALGKSTDEARPDEE